MQVGGHAETFLKQDRDDGSRLLTRVQRAKGVGSLNVELSQTEPGRRIPRPGKKSSP